jgi:alpha-ribazole phosphatase/probable phosphoglycerate mutase
MGVIDLLARLLLVRHAETEWNATRTIQGQRDVALSALGQRQSERLRDRLANGELGYGVPMLAPLARRHATGAADAPPPTAFRIDRVYASDLKRSVDTAAILAAPWGREVETSAALREMHWGRFQGYTTAHVMEQWPEAYNAWVADQMDTRPPEGETLREVAARARVFFQGVIEAHAEETVLVVAHGGSLRTGLCFLMRLPASAHWQFRLDNTSLTVVDTYPEGSILSLLNDTSHLRGLV